MSDFNNLHTELTRQIINCAIKVHRTLGPGFVESVYENALAFEMESRNIPFARQLGIELKYMGHVVGTHRLDLLVDDKVIVELKAKDEICPADRATTLSYLKATGKSIALIINFGKSRVEVKRMGNNGTIF